MRWTCRSGARSLGTTQYTTQGDEAQRGSLHRINGAEEQIPEGVKLGGGTQGLRFDAAALDLGTGSQSFVMETVFTPTSNPILATYLSAGGNVFVRAQDGKLRYGYSTNATGAWVNNYKEATLPALNEKHALSMHYRATSAGVVMDVSVDGEALPAVTGNHPATVAAGLNKTFGFGNDVNAQGNDRGMVGTLHQVRVNGTDGAGDGYELHPSPAAVDQLLLGFDGTATGGGVHPHRHPARARHPDRRGRQLLRPVQQRLAAVRLLR